MSESKQGDDDQPKLACPSCGEEFSVDLQAVLPEQTDLTFVIQVKPGELIQLKTLGGILTQFEKLQREIGKEVGCNTAVLLSDLEMDGSDIHIHMRIANSVKPARRAISKAIPNG